MKKHDQLKVLTLFITLFIVYSCTSKQYLKEVNSVVTIPPKEGFVEKVEVEG